jgi:hypothetical protein
MWYFSSVLVCFPFSCVFMISMVSVMGPYLCPVFSMWFEYPELPLLFFSNMCSLYLVWNVEYSIININSINKLSFSRYLNGSVFSCYKF